MTDFSHITPCGEDCSDCEHYIEKRCDGCLENGGKCVHMWENGCEIFSCCTAHKAAFCGVCGEFPCQWLKDTLIWEKNGIERLAVLGKEYRVQKGDNYVSK